MAGFFAEEYWVQYNLYVWKHTAQIFWNKSAGCNVSFEKKFSVLVLVACFVVCDDFKFLSKCYFKGNNFYNFKEVLILFFDD